MKTLTAFILLIILIVAMAAISSTGEGGGGGANAFGTPTVSDQPVQATIMSADATATFGAEEFYIQLTAIAEQEQ